MGAAGSLQPCVVQKTSETFHTEFDGSHQYRLCTKCKTFFMLCRLQFRLGFGWFWVPAEFRKWIPFGMVDADGTRHNIFMLPKWSHPMRICWFAECAMRKVTTDYRVEQQQQQQIDGVFVRSLFYSRLVVVVVVIVVVVVMSTHSNIRICWPPNGGEKRIELFYLGLVHSSVASATH